MGWTTAVEEVSLPCAPQDRRPSWGYLEGCVYAPLGAPWTEVFCAPRKQCIRWEVLSAELERSSNSRGPCRLETHLACKCSWCHGSRQTVALIPALPRG